MNGRQQSGPDEKLLLVMVPGMGIKTTDFSTQGLIDTARQRWPIAIVPVDPGPESYLDGSVEERLLRLIAQASDAIRPDRIWLAGISLGCQAILRCVQRQPDLAEGLILLTPYVASTGLIAEVVKAGGLRRWALANPHHDNRERALLTWMAAALSAPSPRIMLGYALADRFAATATLLAQLLPAQYVVTVSGQHDWTSWRALWHLILDQDPFARAVTS